MGVALVIPAGVFLRVAADALWLCLQRDRTFAETRCIPITVESLSPSTSASTLSTA